MLSGARFNRYLHNDATSLAKRLEKASGSTLVVTDGVFSMDGDLADLPALARETKAKGAWLMVDDAHGFGRWAPLAAGLPSTSAWAWTMCRCWWARWARPLVPAALCGG